MNLGVNRKSQTWTEAFQPEGGSKFPEQMHPFKHNINSENQNRVKSGMVVENSSTFVVLSKLFTNFKCKKNDR